MEIFLYQINLEELESIGRVKSVLIRGPQKENLKELTLCSLFLLDNVPYLKSKKGIFVCYEIKSCKQDVYSGNGLNFIGEKNYIVTTMECYKDLLPDMRDGKFYKHLHEVSPDSSGHLGIMVAIPYMSELTDEFENPTELDFEKGRWKLAVISNCRLGLRKKSTTELLFCMLRSGR